MKPIDLSPTDQSGPTLAADSAAARTCPGLPGEQQRCGVPLQEGEERCLLCRYLEEHAPRDLQRAHARLEARRGY